MNASHYLPLAMILLLAGCGSLPSPPSLPGAPGLPSSQNLPKTPSAPNLPVKTKASEPVKKAVQVIQQMATSETVEKLAKMGVKTVEEMLVQWVKDPFYSPTMQVAEEEAAQKALETPSTPGNDPASPGQPALPEITVSSIAYHPKMAMAVLMVGGESTFVRVGDRVGDATVTKITPDAVTVGAQTIQLPDIVGFAQTSTPSSSPPGTGSPPGRPPGSPSSGSGPGSGQSGSPDVSSLVDSVLNGIKN